MSSEYGWRYSWFFLGGLVLLIGAAAYLLLRDRPEEKGLRPIGAEDTPNPSSAFKESPPKSKSWGLVYKSGIVWHLAMIYAMFGFSYIIYVTFFADYLTDEIGVSIEGAGYLWGIVGWISILCGILWGWISDWIGRKYALALVFFLQGCAYACFAIWTSSLGLLVSAVVFGITALEHPCDYGVGVWGSNGVPGWPRQRWDL